MNHSQIHKVSLYPDDIELKLELVTIKDSLRELCLGQQGILEVDNLTLYTEHSTVQNKLSEVFEFKQIQESDKNFPIESYNDVNESLKMLEIPNSVISGEEFNTILKILVLIEKIIRFLKTEKENVPTLFESVNDIKFLKEIKDAISKVVDDEGYVKSGSSTVLKQIRLGLESKVKEIDKKFSQVLKYCRKNEWLSDELESVRKGDRVLAVLSKYKRKVPGIIYDESSTGKTTFIQPESIISLRNALFELKQDENREIFRILNKLGQKVRPHINEIRTYQSLLGRFDLIHAKALFAIRINAEMPEIVSQQIVHIQEGFHPLLMLVNNQLGKKTIPLNISLDSNNSILIISGPNAGGKSVCLKTVGLLQLMLQSGMLIPVASNSKMGIFEKVFIDIGDDQSIDNDLSTYSSRLQNMKYFIQNSNDKTLFLLDEFGSGTDPQVGGIIAEEILERLRRCGAFGIVTTHYTNLKLYASNTYGVNNGAMLFDVEKLIPTYQLQIGEPGSSYSMEIVQNIGFDTEFIKSTLSKLDKQHVSMDKLLIDLRKEKEDIEIKKNTLKIKQNQLDITLEDNKILKQKLNNELEKVITESNERVLDYLKTFNKKYENLVKAWKEKSKDEKQDAIKDIKSEISYDIKKIQQDISSGKERKKKVMASKSIVLGSYVIIKGGEQIGRVEKIKNEKATVIFGNVKSVIDLSKLEMADKQAIPKSNQKTTLIRFKDNDFSPNIDIRGKRREEAIQIVESFIDQGLLSDFKTLRILHGTGDGVLRLAVHSIMEKYSFVKAFRSESREFGGEGITIVELE